MVGESISTKIIDDIKRLVATLQKENIHIERAILFGSYATGTNHKFSDIDVALASPDFSGIRYLDNKKISATKLFINSNFETHPFTPEDFADSPFVRDEILKHGIEIH